MALGQLGLWQYQIKHVRLTVEILCYCVPIIQFCDLKHAR